MKDIHARIADADAILVGRFIVATASAEALLGRIWWALCFDRSVPLTQDESQRVPLAKKLDSMVDVVADSVPLQRLILELCRDAYKQIAARRQALVHGYYVEAGSVKGSLNLRDESRTYVDDLPLLFEWGSYLQALAERLDDEVFSGLQDLPQSIGHLPIKPHTFS